MEDALGQVRSLGGLGGVSMPTLGLKRSDVGKLHVYLSISKRFSLHMLSIVITIQFEWM